MTWPFRRDNWTFKRSYLGHQRRRNNRTNQWYYYTVLFFFILIYRLLTGDLSIVDVNSWEMGPAVKGNAKEEHKFWLPLEGFLEFSIRNFGDFGLVVSVLEMLPLSLSLRHTQAWRLAQITEDGEIGPPAEAHGGRSRWLVRRICELEVDGRLLRY